MCVLRGKCVCVCSEGGSVFSDGKVCVLRGRCVF